ncbi:MAG TPA: YihY/virulence factor BrkB family protein [Actinomycetota bacterium]|nr:YihY/virulence factor BrkB family protein [Actinomycetota bacterium]
MSTAALRSAWTLIRLTARSAREDRITAIAAQLAFFALLAIPSALLLLAGTAGYVDRLFGSEAGAALKEQVETALGSFLDPDAMRSFVQPIVDDLFAGGRADLLSIGALVGLWSASRAVRVLIESMNIAYDIDDWRPAWKRRLIAIGLSVGGLIAMAVIVPLMLAGPGVGEALVRRLGLPPAFGSTWRILYWPVAALVVVGGLATLYHIAPNWRTPWTRDLPGAFLAAAAWVAAAWGLRVYVSRAISETTAGPLAAPMILLLWLYVSGLAVLLGAELNAEIERMRQARNAQRRGPAARLLERFGSRRARRTREEAEADQQDAAAEADPPADPEAAGGLIERGAHPAGDPGRTEPGRERNTNP